MPHSYTTGVWDKFKNFKWFHLKLFKKCIPQIVPFPFLITLFHIMLLQAVEENFLSLNTWACETCSKLTRGH